VRILFVADVSIERVIGGAERMLFEQATRLARKGHEIHNLTRMPPGGDHLQFTTRQVTEHRYGVAAGNPLAFLCSTLHNARRLAENLLSTTAYDCIHFQQPFSAAGVLLSRRARRIPTIYSNYSLSFEEFVSRNPLPAGWTPQMIYRANRGVRRWVEKWVLGHCRTIVVLSRFSRQRLRDAHGIHSDRTELIPGGVDTDKFTPVSDKLSIRRRLRLPENGVVLLTVRNLVPRMGLENLLLAFKAAASHAPDLYLVIAGDGPLKDRLRELARRERIAEKMVFAGFVPEGELPSYYQMADLFVLPTRELEGFGLVTLESLACGVPVAGTPVGGTKEILGRFDPGFLFRDASPAAMADLILKCYDKITMRPMEWVQLGLNCRRFVEENFSWDASIGALEELYRKTIAGAAR
jgi:glycosyltransferase involved in cell wall biosynthesis